MKAFGLKRHWLCVVELLGWTEVAAECVCVCWYIFTTLSCGIVTDEGLQVEMYHQYNLFPTSVLNQMQLTNMIFICKYGSDSCVGTVGLNILFVCL